MNASPTRNACTFASRMRFTSSGAMMPDSVTTSLSAGMRGSRPMVVSQRRLERAQVAVVDADQRRAQLQRRGQLVAVMHFHQHVQAQFQRAGFQFRHQAVVERRDDQQDRIGAHRARFVDLVHVDHEVLAQHRNLAGGARLLQVVHRALEEMHVGQHRQARRAMARVALGDVRRLEVRAQHAFRRRRLLHFGDHAGVARRDVLAQARFEAAQAARGLRRRLPLRGAGWPGRGTFWRRRLRRP